MFAQRRSGTASALALFPLPVYAIRIAAQHAPRSVEALLMANSAASRTPFCCAGHYAARRRRHLPASPRPTCSPATPVMMI